MWQIPGRLKQDFSSRDRDVLVALCKAPLTLASTRRMLVPSIRN